MPIAAHINGRAYAIHTDHLNTPRRLTNAQGQVAWQWLVTGFGEVQPTLGSNGYALNSIDNGQKYSEAVRFNLRYPGQQWDAETRLSYNLNRYYDPHTGRYIQSDPIGLEGGVESVCIRRRIAIDENRSIGTGNVYLQASIRRLTRFVCASAFEPHLCMCWKRSEHDLWKYNGFEWRCDE